MSPRSPALTGPSPPAVAEPRQLMLRRLTWALAITLLLTHGVMAWMSRTPSVTPAANDDAQYLLLARSLRAFSYTDAHIPGAPVHAQYPPGYPAMLAVATGLFGETVDVALAVTLLCSLAALFFIFDIVRRLTTPALALLVLAALVFNTHLIQLGGRVATERPYALFAVGTLWLLVAFPATRRTLVLAGLAAILAALTRSVGLSLVAALALTWLLQKRFRALAVFALAAGVTVGGWLYWTSVAPNQFTERSYAAVATSTARHLPGPLGMLEVRSVKFVQTYVLKSFGSGLNVPTIEGTSVDNALWVLAIVGFAAVGLWWLRRRATIIPLFLLAYLGLLLLYPYKLTRFFLPIASLLLVAMLVGAWVAGQRWKPWLGLALPGLLAGLILANEIPLALGKAASLEGCDRSRPVSSACWAPDRLAFIKATRRAAATIPRDAIVVTIKEATFHWYTGRKVVHPDFAALKGGTDVVGYLERTGIRYVLISPFVGGAKFARFLGPVCDRVEVLERIEPRTALLHLVPAGSPVAGPSACGLIEDWVTQADVEEGEDEVE